MYYCCLPKNIWSFGWAQIFTIQNVPIVFPSHVTPNQCPKAGKMVREAFTANLFLCPLPISSYKRLQQHEF